MRGGLYFDDGREDENRDFETRGDGSCFVCVPTLGGGLVGGGVGEADVIGVATLGSAEVSVCDGVPIDGDWTNSVGGDNICCGTVGSSAVFCTLGTVDVWTKDDEVDGNNGVFCIGGIGSIRWRISANCAIALYVVSPAFKDGDILCGGFCSNCRMSVAAWRRKVSMFMVGNGVECGRKVTVPTSHSALVLVK